MGRRMIFIICLTIASLQINAQSEHKFSIGLMSSMDYYKYKNNIYYGLSVSDATVNYSGYHLGIKIQYDINKKFSIRSGINFSKLTYQIDLSKHLIPINPVDPILFNSSILTQKVYYLNIPLMAGYTIYKKGKFLHL